MAKLDFLIDFFNVISTAGHIRQDNEKRAKSVRFGVTGIIISIIAVAFSAGAAFLLSLLINGNSDAVLLFIFVIAGVLVCAGGMILMFLGALVRVIAQLVINRKPISWIALVIFILCIGAAVFLFILFCK